MGPELADLWSLNGPFLSQNHVANVSTGPWPRTSGRHGPWPRTLEVLDQGPLAQGPRSIPRSPWPRTSGRQSRPLAKDRKPLLRLDSLAKDLGAPRVSGHVALAKDLGGSLARPSGSPEDTGQMIKMKAGFKLPPPHWGGGGLPRFSSPFPEFPRIFNKPLKFPEFPRIPFQFAMSLQPRQPTMPVTD